MSVCAVLLIWPLASNVFTDLKAGPMVERGLKGARLTGCQAKTLVVNLACRLVMSDTFGFGSDGAF